MLMQLKAVTCHQHDVVCLKGLKKLFPHMYATESSSGFQERRQHP